MTTAYRHRKALTCSALILVATGLPFVLPFSATLLGRLVSAGTSMVLLGGGYFLIVDSALASLLMAVTACELLFALSFAIDRGIGASHVR